MICQYKRIIYDKSIEAFRKYLHQYDWNTTETQQFTNKAYYKFIVIFCTFYDTFFPMKMVKITTKDSDSPLITKGIEKTSKGKQPLYSKFKETTTTTTSTATTTKKLDKNIKITKSCFNLI